MELSISPMQFTPDFYFLSHITCWQWLLAPLVLTLQHLLLTNLGRAGDVLVWSDKWMCIYPDAWHRSAIRARPPSLPPSVRCHRRMAGVSLSSARKEATEAHLSFALPMQMARPGQSSDLWRAPQSHRALEGLTLLQRSPSNLGFLCAQWCTTIQLSVSPFEKKS